MVQRCIAGGCSRSSKDGVSLHVIPKDAKVRRKWRKFVEIKRKNVHVSDTSVLCSKHFRDEDYHPGSLGMLRAGLTNHRRLSVGAVPSVHPPSDAPGAQADPKPARQRKSRALHKLEVNRLLAASADARFPVQYLSQRSHTSDLPGAETDTKPVRQRESQAVQKLEVEQLLVTSDSANSRSHTPDLPNHLCAAVGCVSASHNIDKYPDMEGVTFHSFPSAENRPELRQKWIDSLKRTDWTPKHFARVCSKHFVGGTGPTFRYPMPTLFQYNNYKAQICENPVIAPKQEAPEPVIQWTVVDDLAIIPKQEPGETPKKNPCEILKQGPCETTKQDICEIPKQEIYEILKEEPCETPKQAICDNPKEILSESVGHSATDQQDKESGGCNEASAGCHDNHDGCKDNSVACHDNSISCQDDGVECHDDHIGCHDDSVECHDDHTGCHNDRVGCHDDHIGSPNNSVGCHDDSVGCPDNCVGCPDNSVGSHDDSVGCHDDSVRCHDMLDSPHLVAEPGTTDQRDCTTQTDMTLEYIQVLENIVHQQNLELAQLRSKLQYCNGKNGS